MDISNLQASIIGVLAMLFGYGMRLKGYKISGDIAIAIGMIGIPVVIFYDKICSFIKSFLGISAQNINYTIPGIIIISIGVIGILVTAIYSCWKRWRNKRAQISTSEHLSLDSIKKLKEKEDAANIDQFPILNEESLKKHILLIIKNRDYPLNALIDKVSLYQGVDDVKYILVVKLGINEQHPNFLEFMNHW